VCYLNKYTIKSIDSTDSIQARNVNFHQNVDWVGKPALKRAGLDYREMKQTRHSFATNASSCGENPLWIARVKGHRDTDMIIRVYGKYIENFNGTRDENNLNDFYNGNTKKDE